jgi:LPS-assembly protein
MRMFSLRSGALALLAALLLLPAAVAGQERTAVGKDKPAVDRKKPVGDEIYLSAASVERRADDGIVVGEGAVEIVTRDLRLVADRVLYHEETHDVVADGHVILDSGPDRLQGTHLELNIDTRVGFVEEGQGFIQTYYFTGKRIDKVGPDRYFIRDGTFTTCEGTLPDWSFHATTTTITIDEYLQAWNPSMWVTKAPVFYLPYAVFPIKRDRSTGFLIPEVRYRKLEGLVVRNHFFWAPRDDFDATIGLDYFQNTGWGATGELRYLLAAQSHGEVTAYYTKNPDTEAQRWYLKADLIHQLPFNIRGQAQALIQNDRNAIDTLGSTLEDTSSERTTSSFYLNRSWSAYDFSLTGRSETSLLTARDTTLTRFPELSIDRTSTRLFDTDLFLKVSTNGVRLSKVVETKTPSPEDPDVSITTTTSYDTTRLYFSPELSWPISVGGILRLIPTAGYSFTYYSEDREGNEARRSLPFYRLGAEGPKVFRVWEFAPGGGVEKIKHLLEPRLSYVYTPKENQDNLPQFDSIDAIAPANRLEYSLTNTLFAKVLPPPLKKEPVGEGEAPETEGMFSGLKALPAEKAEPAAASTTDGLPAFRTEELVWVRLSQSYIFDREVVDVTGQALSPVEWESRTRPWPGLEISWKGNWSVYGEGVGYQNVAGTWKALDLLTLNAEWRTTKGANQDFLDLGLTVPFTRMSLEGRSRYNLDETTFVENRVAVKYLSQCWDIAFAYVKWPNDYEYSIQLSLKGIGTIVKF